MVYFSHAENIYLRDKQMSKIRRSLNPFIEGLFTTLSIKN